MQYRSIAQNYIKIPGILCAYCTKKIPVSIFLRYGLKQNAARSWSQVAKTEPAIHISEIQFYGIHFYEKGGFLGDR